MATTLEGQPLDENTKHFLQEAHASHHDFHGISVKAVLTDNGSCYRSRAFAAALGPHLKHRRTRPYRPQTNGKVERFNRTLATEWAYARPYTSETERAATYNSWLHQYNHHRTHTGIGGKTPISRVHNVRENYT